MRRNHELHLFNGSVLVAEGGSVIHKKGYGLANMEWDIPNAPDTKFRLGSITKQFTAALILQLAAEGKLDLQAPFGRYVPEYPATVAGKVTIHHLLTHTSGIVSYTGIKNFRSEMARDPYKPLEFIKVFADLPVEFASGEKFKYNNSGYFLLGVVIEKVTGDTYEEALRKRIFDPLDMKDSGHDHHRTLLPKRATGYRPAEDGFENADYLDMSLPYAAGSLYSTAEDLYKWDQALYTDKVLPGTYRKLMFQPHQKVPDKKRTFSYGYGWFIETVDRPGGEGTLEIVGHGGGINGFNTRIHRFPKDRHLIVLLNNFEGARGLNPLLEGIRAILYGQKPKPPRRPEKR